MQTGSLENLKNSSAYISNTGEWCWLTSYSQAQFVYIDDTQVRVSSSHYMKYAVGENVMSCTQSAECDKATKISVTEGNHYELQFVGILLALINTHDIKNCMAYIITAYWCSRPYDIWKEFLAWVNYFLLRMSIITWVPRVSKTYFLTDIFCWPLLTFGRTEWIN